MNAQFLRAELLHMGRKSSNKTSQTDWAHLRTLPDQEIQLSAEHPEAASEHIVRGLVRRGLVRRGLVRRGLQPVVSKEAISLRVDADVLAWFQAQGAGWQARMNLALKAFKEASVPPPTAARKAPACKRASL